MDLRWQMVLGCLGATERRLREGALQAFRERLKAALDRDWSDPDQKASAVKALVIELENLKDWLSLRIRAGAEDTTAQGRFGDATAVDAAGSGAGPARHRTRAAVGRRSARA